MDYEALYAAQAPHFEAPLFKGLSFANEWRNEWKLSLIHI